MRVAIVTLAHLLLLAAVSVLAAAYLPAKIQAAIYSDVRQQLSQKGFTNLSVWMDGRSLSLTGQVANPAQRQLALEITQQRPGVASVKNRITVKFNK